MAAKRFSLLLIGLLALDGIALFVVPCFQSHVGSSRSTRLRMVVNGAAPSNSAWLLLVDDEEPLRRAVGGYLTQHGYNVETKESALQALAYLKDGSLTNKPLPDVIISDITMPGMDGFQFLQQLNSYPTLKRIPVILLTARGMAHDRIKGYRAGAHVYVPKPFDPEELISIIDSLVVRYRNDVSSTGVEDLRRELSDIKSMLIAGGSVSSGGSNAIGSYSNSNMVNGNNLENGDADIGGGTFAGVQITSKEQTVLNYLCRGFTNREIAEEMDTSIRNVEKHMTRLLSKTGCSNRTELVKFAMNAGMRSN